MACSLETFDNTSDSECERLVAVALGSSNLIRDRIISHDQVRSSFHRPILSKCSRFYGSAIQSGKKKKVWSVEHHHGFSGADIG